MIRALIVGLVLALAGCAGGPLMSPEQIAATVKDKNLTMFCLIANTPYGKGTTTVVNLDKTTLPTGSTVTVDDACKVSITTGRTP